MMDFDANGVISNEEAIELDINVIFNLENLTLLQFCKFFSNSLLRTKIIKGMN